MKVADKCDPIRSNLADLENRLKGIRKFDPPEPSEPGEPRQKPQLNLEWLHISGLVDSKRFELRQCERSISPPPPPPPPPTPVPLTLTLTNFVCLDQSDEIRVLFGFNTEDDEPYALVFAVDLKTTNLVVPIPVGAINSKITLVGPLADVDLEDISAPFNVIWGLSNSPDIISSANNLIILVVMMENDTSSPAQVRTVLEKSAQLSLLANLPAFTSQQIPRQELVNRIINDMNGALGVAKVGIPDPDDNIGAIQELRFFPFELDDIYRGRGSIEKSLNFEGDDARYILKFRMFR